MDNKYIIDTNENNDFLKNQYNTILKFGVRFPSSDGSSYYLGDDGTPWTERLRETWITSRMAHVYSIGYMLGNKEYKDLATKAIKGLSTTLYDNINGGFYSAVDKDGNPIKKKECYQHAFVMLASSTAYLAKIDGAKSLLDKAVSIYDKYFWDEEIGLSVDSYNNDFSILDSYRGLNANMHTVESFLALADALDDNKYRIRARRIIDKVIKWASANDYRIPEHYTDKWIPDLEKNIENPADPFKPYGATPGHGIEWSRLIAQYGVSVDDLSYVDYSIKLYERAISDAWNNGIAYTTDWNGKPVCTDRMHWTLAEAINTSAVLYRITMDERFKNDYSMFMEYLDKYVIDHKNGSWYHQLDLNNKLKETVWPGKSDLYHAFQAMLIPYLDVDTSIGRAIYNKMEK